MAEFLEERLPLTVRLGASTEDDYAVEITTTAAGAEYRRLVHGLPMRRFRVKFTMAQADLTARVASLYHRVNGRYAGFRVRCLDDFSTRADGRSAPTAIDHELPRLSAGVYQLRKRYGVGGTPSSLGLPVRTIYKPVAGTVVLAKNGVTIVAGITVNAVNGQVTIAPAPLITDTITGGCEFDLPCRFDGPLQVTSRGGEARDTAEFDLIELLSP
jgi:uncharacterized protein (TIGR02217 family)